MIEIILYIYTKLYHKMMYFVAICQIDVPDINWQRQWAFGSGITLH